MKIPLPEPNEFTITPTPLSQRYFEVRPLTNTGVPARLFALDAPGANSVVELAEGSAPLGQAAVAEGGEAAGLSGIESFRLPSVATAQRLEPVRP